MDKKSPDAFRTISEVAEWLGVPTHVLRFWESRFTQVKPVKRAGGRRYYRPSDMALLGGIRKLLHEDGMTIRGVQKLLREHGVKHVAEMSPAIESASESAGEESPVPSNVVPFEAGLEVTPEETASAPTNEGNEGTVAPAEPEPTAASTGLPPHPSEAAAPAAQAPDEVPEAPMAFPDQEMALAPAPASSEVVSLSEETTPSATPDARSAAEAPVDPLEPIPHEGPTLAETLAAQQPTPAQEAPSPDLAGTANETETETSDDTAALSEETVPSEEIDAVRALSTDQNDDPGDAPETTDSLAAPEESAPTRPDTDTHAAEEQSAKAPLLGAEETADQIGDLFSFADSVPEETPAAPAAMGVTPVEPPSEAPDITDEEPADEEPALAAPDTSPETAPQFSPDPQNDASVAPAAEDTSPLAEMETPQVAPEDVIDGGAEPSGDGAAAQAQETESTDTAPAPQMGDISHIPADPEDESVVPPLPALPPVLRDAKSAGTDVHLPVLQALADRLEALAGQMDRTHGI